MPIINKSNHFDDDFFKKGKSGFNSNCGCVINCGSNDDHNQCCPTNTALPSVFCHLLQQLVASLAPETTVAVFGSGGRVYTGTITAVQSNYFVLRATSVSIQTVTPPPPTITFPTNVYIPFTSVESIVPLS